MSTDRIETRDEAEEHIRKQQFEYSGRWRSSWRRQAEDLRRAAGYLHLIYSSAGERNLARFLEKAPVPGIREIVGEERSDLHDEYLRRVYIMLMGFAIENLLKGILIGRQPELVTDSGHLHKNLQTHDLTTLFTKCAIPVSDEERESVRLLTAHVLWAGRYPIPLTKRDMDIGDSPQLQPEFLHDLYDRLWHQLENERLAQGPHSP